MFWWEIKIYSHTLSFWIPVNRYFDKQWRPKWNTPRGRICSGSALFVKIKTIFRGGVGRGGGLVSIRLWGLPFIVGGIWHKGFFGYMHLWVHISEFFHLKFVIIFYPKVYYIFWVLKRTASLKKILSMDSMDPE